MKIRDIIKNIEKSSKTSSWVEVETLALELGLPYGEYREQELLTSYYFGSWICTDTRVGYKVYFLDDEAVAVSVQNGRKSDEYMEWLSEELAVKTRDYLLSLLIPKEDKLNVDIVDLDEDLGDGFYNNFYGQIDYKNDMTYEGEKVKILHVIPEEYHLGTQVKIEKQNGQTEIVNTNQLKLAFYLTSKETNTND